MPQLGGWVHRQRLKKKSPRKYGGLTDCQINQLDELGFCWFIRCMNGNNIQKQQDQ
jgi:Helicase associated domain